MEVEHETGSDALAQEPEEVAAETEEELAARLEREEVQRRLAEEERARISAANCARVEFRSAVVKDIVHPHSSSILAKDGAVAQLSARMEEATRAAYAAAAADAETGTVPATVEMVSKLLIQVEATPFTEGSDLLNASVSKLLDQGFQGTSDPAFTSDDEFVAFVAKWHNPPYYYGERVRKLVGRGCLEDCLDIFTRGCDVNTADGEGTSALHYCAEFNRVDIIRALSDVFQGGLILNAKDKAGWTPLHNAVHYGNIECAQELLMRGASPNVTNSVGKSPCHSAAAQGRTDICKLLLENGANPAQPDSTGMTPLHEAAYKVQPETYQILLEAPGAEPAAKDKLGNTANDYLGSYRGGEGEDVDATRADPSAALPTPPASRGGSGAASVASNKSNKSKK